MPDNSFVDPSNPLRDDWAAAWETEDNYWTENFSSRPYAIGPDYYERFRPAYRYGFESARHNLGRSWDDVESDLQTGWSKYEYRPEGGSTWDKVKDAVRDAWHRVTGQEDLDTHKMAESNTTSRGRRQ